MGVEGGFLVQDYFSCRKGWLNLHLYCTCTGFQQRDEHAAFRHGHQEGGSAMAWASGITVENTQDLKRTLQVCLVPGLSDRVVVTGMGGKVGREQAEVALSWLQSTEASITETLRVNSFVRRVAGSDHGVHLHLLPASSDKRSGVLGTTMAVGLVSLALGRLPCDRVVLLGELRLDGARTGMVQGLSRSILERCTTLGITNLIVGVGQVSHSDNLLR